MSNHCYKHNCIEELVSDHKKILEKLNKLEKAVSEKTVDKNKIKEFLEFTENFAEPHHEKEEKVLFPALEEKGIPRDGGPIGMMMSEHEMKREYVRGLKKAVTENNEDVIRQNSKAIILLLRDHIYKEDNILYPCAKDVLTKEELSDMGKLCEKLKQ